MPKIETKRYMIEFEEKQAGGAGGYEAAYLTSEGKPASKKLYTLLAKLDEISLPVENRAIRQRNGSELIKALEQEKSLGIASGFKPSGAFHFGHTQTSSGVAFFQKNGAQIFMPVADLECMLDSELTEKQYKFWAADNLLDWGANRVDLDAAHIYLQSEEFRVGNLAYLFARGLSFDLALDTYGLDKLSKKFAFLFAGVAQVGDIALPQHSDFSNQHSFMVSGQDQDGHMKMAIELMKKAFESKLKLPGIQTVSSGFYIPHMRGLGPKMSSSKPESTLYLGPGPNKEDIETRIKSSIIKIDNALKDPELKKEVKNCALDMVRYIQFFNAKSQVNFPEALKALPNNIKREQDAEKKSELIDKYLINYCKKAEQDNVALVRESLPEALKEHQKKRQIVLDYALSRTRSIGQGGGWEIDGAIPRPEFWNTPKKAVVDASKRTQTQWFNMVESMRDKLIA